MNKYFKIFLIFELFLLITFLIGFFVFEAEQPKDEFGKGFVPNDIHYSLSEQQINFSNVTFTNYSIRENLNR